MNQIPVRDKTKNPMPGDKFEFLTLLMKVRFGKNTPYYRRNSWRVQCVCGTRLTIPFHYLIRPENARKHCGCKFATFKSTNKEMLTIYNMMRQRCYFEHHKCYKDYGGRGIKICDEWLDPEDGFRKFVEFMGPRPSPGHTVDRVNNDMGYQPYQEDGVTRQVRWATAKEQRANQRPRKV